MDERRPGKYLNLRLMEERIIDVAEAYATWNVPHFVPIKDFTYFTLHHLKKHFSSVGHQGRRKFELRTKWGGNLRIYID